MEYKHQVKMAIIKQYKKLSKRKYLKIFMIILIGVQEMGVILISKIG